MARQSFEQSGYSNVRNYKGSWLEWEALDFPIDSSEPF